jgi:hypothetical protein
MAFFTALRSWRSVSELGVFVLCSVSCTLDGGWRNDLVGTGSLCRQKTALQRPSLLPLNVFIIKAAWVLFCRFVEKHFVVLMRYSHPTTNKTHDQRLQRLPHMVNFYTFPMVFKIPAEHLLTYMYVYHRIWIPHYRYKLLFQKSRQYNLFPLASWSFTGSCLLSD